MKKIKDTADYNFPDNVEEASFCEIVLLISLYGISQQIAAQFEFKSDQREIPEELKYFVIRLINIIGSKLSDYTRIYLEDEGKELVEIEKRLGEEKIEIMKKYKATEGFPENERDNYEDPLVKAQSEEIHKLIEEYDPKIIRIRQMVTKRKINEIDSLFTSRQNELEKYINVIVPDSKNPKEGNRLINWIKNFGNK